DVMDGIAGLVSKLDGVASDRAKLAELAREVEGAVAEARQAAQRARRPAAGGVAAEAFNASMRKVARAMDQLRGAVSLLAKSHDDSRVEPPPRTHPHSHPP
ncbi:hypothetical protein THAOC_29378, partial [Thalassiosira oceanica]